MSAEGAGLGARMVTFTLGVVLSTAVGVATYAIRTEIDARRVEVIASARLVGQMMATNAEYPLYLRDAERLSELVGGVAVDRRFAYAVIETPDGDTLAFHSPAGLAAPPVHRGSDMGHARVNGATFLDTVVEVRPHATPGFDDDTPADMLGRVRIGVAEAELYRTAPEIARGTLTLAAFLALGSLAITLWFTRRLVRPLDELIAAANRVAEGDLDCQPPRATLGETARMVAAFGRMVERLREYRDLEEGHRARLEDSVRLRTQALQIAVQEAQELAREASRANAAKSTFLARMSHELRTPLNAIIGYAELIMEDVEEDEAREDLERIRGAGMHLLGLINDVLDLAKVESGKMEVFYETASPARMVDEVADTVRPLARASGDTLVVDADELPERLIIDARKVRQILINLLSNACRFCTGGEVGLRVRAFREHRQLVFEVWDTGVGIAPEHLERIFVPFEQADGSSTRERDGTGLGLAIARRFAELMGGSLSVTSTVGVGSTFTLSLPLVEERVLEPA